MEHLPPNLCRGRMCDLTSNDAYSILSSMASALSYLAQEEIVHNDIKPANIAYSPQRGAVLLDFGLAVEASSDISSGGTPWYIPPEYMYQRKRGIAGDMYASGVTMLYVLKKTPLPELLRNGWRVAKVAQLGDELRKMRTWTDTVARMRDILDHTDPTERLVHLMLAEEAKERISARELSKVLFK